MPKKRDAAIALVRMRSMSEHFKWAILHSSGVGGGNRETDKRMRQCLSEGGGQNSGDIALPVMAGEHRAATLTPVVRPG